MDLKNKNSSQNKPLSLPLLDLSSDLSSEIMEAGSFLNFPKELFEKAEKPVGVKYKLNRPSLSYWQDAWIRLKKNKQAMFSLVIIVFLIVFVVLGPFLWRLDPNAQSTFQVSEYPHLFLKALVLSEPSAYEEVKISLSPSKVAPLDNFNLAASEKIELLSAPSVESVRLKWEPVSGASAYAIYRNNVLPQNGRLGLPIGEVSSANIISFEDNQGLEPKSYYYSLVAKNNEGQESKNYKTIKVEVPRTISFEQAQKIDKNIQAGSFISLPAAPMGTDQLGRDLLARLMIGGQYSLFIGFVSTFLYVLLGVMIGGISGYYGGAVDIWIMRFTDFVMGLPFLLFMILIKVILGVGPGESGISALIIALVILSWTGCARLVRGQILQIRESDYVHAARLLGAPSYYIIIRHILPNLFGVILISLTFGIPASIFTEAFLSFIGLGVASPSTSWGSLCTEGIQTILNYPHEFFFPSIFIAVTVLAFNLLGDGLRDALDPKMRSV